MTQRDWVDGALWPRVVDFQNEALVLQFCGVNTPYCSGNSELRLRQSVEDAYVVLTVMWS